MSSSAAVGFRFSCTGPVSFVKCGSYHDYGVDSLQMCDSEEDLRILFALALSKKMKAV